MSPIFRDNVRFSGRHYSGIYSLAGAALVNASRSAFFLFLFLWFRATFPRYRYDQIMRLGWKVFIPITIVWIFVEGIAIYFRIEPWFALT